MKTSYLFAFSNRLYNSVQTALALLIWNSRMLGKFCVLAKELSFKHRNTNITPAKAQAEHHPGLTRKPRIRPRLFPRSFGVSLPEGGWTDKLLWSPAAQPAGISQPRQGCSKHITQPSSSPQRQNPRTWNHNDMNPKCRRAKISFPHNNQPSSKPEKPKQSLTLNYLFLPADRNQYSSGLCCSSAWFLLEKHSLTSPYFVRDERICFWTHGPTSAKHNKGN